MRTFFAAQLLEAWNMTLNLACLSTHLPSQPFQPEKRH